MRPAADWLYQLLPIVLRERDPDNGYPLRALLRIIADQAAQLEGDMWQLYDDHFIETCQPWVIPYLGDLVGNELIWDSLRAPAAETAGQLFPDLAGSPTLQPPVAARSRADVANTLRYRRRKGTSSVLEALARDVTGWFVRAVESRLLLARTEHLAHPLGSGGWVDLHAPDLAEVLESPFDAVAHSASISAMPELPRFGPRCMDIYVWRLQSYPVTNVPARAAGTHWRHTFSPLRSRAPLFRTAHPGAADTGPVEELDAPGPIRPTELARHLPDLYGTSLSVVVDGSQVPAEDVEVATLEPWPDQRPESRRIGVDPRAGRLVIGEGFGSITTVDVSCHTGFSGDLGGGPYGRQHWLIASSVRRFNVRAGSNTPDAFPDVIQALAAWSAAGRPDAIIAILDSRTYNLPERLRLRHSGVLAIEAADGQRPLLLTARDGYEIDADAGRQGDETQATLTLSGVAVEGHLVVAGALRRLRLLHCTLVPGRRLSADGELLGEGPSLVVRGGETGPARNRRLRVEVAFSITGSLRLPEDAEGLWLLDSIVDGLGGPALVGLDRGDRDAAPAWIERSTILGASYAKEMNASEVIFTQPVFVDRTQQGCLRYCHVPSGSRTPRRFSCQPDLAIQSAVDEAVPTLPPARRGRLTALAAEAVTPRFTSVQYGDPAYCQLALDGPCEISTGAEDGSEMGAFSFLKQPQRESNLKLRLSEYLPIGFDSAVIHVT